MLDVAILGASGLVGQKFVELLDHHPFLQVKELVASENSRGKTLEELGKWLGSSEMPHRIKGLYLKGLEDELEAKVVFSALPAQSAKEIERSLALEGKIVISKSSANRLEKNVPLLIPEVNAEHLQIFGGQKGGKLICDPNCTTIITCLTLKPLFDEFKVKKIIVNSMQAISGAGYPGVSAMAVLGNVIPYIPGEEEKMLHESQKIFGTVEENEIKYRPIDIFATCTRVPVLNCHSISVHVEFEEKTTAQEVKNAFQEFQGVYDLPSSPQNPLIVREEQDRPQPRLDDNGMSVSVGRIRQGVDDKSIAYFAVGDNLVRGAAGAGILDAELLHQEGLL